MSFRQKSIFPQSSTQRGQNIAPRGSKKGPKRLQHGPKKAPRQTPPDAPTCLTALLDQRASRSFVNQVYVGGPWGPKKFDFSRGFLAFSRLGRSWGRLRFLAHFDPLLLLEPKMDPKISKFSQKLLFQERPLNRLHGRRPYVFTNGCGLAGALLGPSSAPQALPKSFKMYEINTPPQ